METGHTIVFLIVIDISYPLMITVFEFMFILLQGLYRTCAVTVSHSLCLNVSLQAVFSEFGHVTNIHISTEVFRLYKEVEQPKQMWVLFRYMWSRVDY